ncbi:type VII secretion target [Streptomyces meridianus]|uniref:Type VII secretion target n=1 Tax=Streptomyces meridianus TaxID=2938945 RepID=A0ABT0XBV4_9ACTN|nr:type VII secretion target [Streptomyces meridianus]MCM2579860.1 type VII secretion target [Streptomyces meridianus]
MSEEVHVDTGELRRLGTAFENHAYDLGRHLSAFRRRTDAGILRDELGTGTAASLAELGDLAEEAGRMVGSLRERLDEIAAGLRTAALTTEASEGETAGVLRSAR